MNLGWTELLLLLGIGLIFFGPSRLPGLGKSLGEAIRGFKKGINTDEEDVKEARQSLSHEESKKTYEADKATQDDKSERKVKSESSDS